MINKDASWEQHIMHLSCYYFVHFLVA